MNTNGNAYDHAGIRRAFKAIREPGPLLEAMLEWFDGLDDIEQHEVLQAVQNIIFRMRNVTCQSFGPAQALELLGCLIAIECEWISPSLPRRMYARNGHRGK